MKPDHSKEPLRRRLTRILAFLGALFLAGLYVVTLILGLTASENTQKLLMASIVCTVVIPVLIYAMMLIARVLDGRNSPGKEASREQPGTSSEANVGLREQSKQKQRDQKAGKNQKRKGAESHDSHRHF